MNRGAWWAAVRGVSKSRLGLNDSARTHARGQRRESILILFERFQWTRALPFFFFLKKELENFILARFEDCKLGRATQKALRTISLQVKTQLI